MSGCDDDLEVGQWVEKYTGDYSAEGEVRAKFWTTGGFCRYVVEHPCKRGVMLHIYSRSNIRPAVRPMGK